MTGFVIASLLIPPLCLGSGAIRTSREAEEEQATLDEVSPIQLETLDQSSRK